MTEFKAANGIDVSRDKMVIQRLKEAGEKAKIELSSTLETEINLPFLTADATGPKHLVLKLSRSKLEQLMGDLIAEDHRAVEARASTDANKPSSEIAEVVLVGGSTRIPMVQQKVREFFGKEGAQGRQSRRGGRARCGGSGWRAFRRRQGHPAARRDPAVAGHRDAGRRDDAR